MTSSTSSFIIPEPDLHPVTDDLAGLERFLETGPDDIEALALVRRGLPGPLQTRGRALAHIAEVRRLIRSLATGYNTLPGWQRILVALTYLNIAAHLATLLLPASNDDDRWAKDQLARDLIEQAEHRGDPETMAITRRAIAGAPSLGRAVIEADDRAALGAFLAALARRAGAAAPGVDAGALPGVPGFHPLEHSRSLERFLASAPDLAGLYRNAQALLLRSDALPDHGHPTFLVEAAIEGARLIGYARLIRIALWPTGDAVDAAVKARARDLVRSRSRDPDRMGAIFEIALDHGQMLSATLAQIDA
jgi:hypothetical protein